MENLLSQIASLPATKKFQIVLKDKKKVVGFIVKNTDHIGTINSPFALSAEEKDGTIFTQKTSLEFTERFKESDVTNYEINPK